MLPFDWRTPFGYLVASFAQFLANIAIEFTVIPFSSLFVASSLFFVTIVDDLTEEMTTFNNDVITSDGTDYDEMMQRFLAIVQSHTDAKQ